MVGIEMREKSRMTPSSLSWLKSEPIIFILGLFLTGLFIAFVFYPGLESENWTVLQVLIDVGMPTAPRVRTGM